MNHTQPEVSAQRLGALRQVLSVLVTSFQSVSSSDSYGCCQRAAERQRKQAQEPFTWVATEPEPRLWRDVSASSPSISSHVPVPRPPASLVRATLQPLPLEESGSILNRQQGGQVL